MNAEKNAEQEQLTAQQEKAILKLLSRRTAQDAAAAAGVSRTTLWRWRQQPEFKARLKTEKQQVIEEAATMLQGACAEAAGILLELALDRASPGASRYKAAKLILDYTMKIREQEEVIDRLDSLEEQLGEDRERSHS